MTGHCCSSWWSLAAGWGFLLRLASHLYIRLVFFIVTLCRFFLVVHTRFCPVITCLHSFLICSTLLFLLVPRVSWLRARGYIPSAFDWLRRTRDPLFRNLYNNKLNWFIHNFKKLIIYLTNPYAQLCEKQYHTEYYKSFKECCDVQQLTTSKLWMKFYVMS